jgi:hypothetical protein
MFQITLKPITENWNGQSATDKEWYRILTGVEAALSDVTTLHFTLPARTLSGTAELCE